MTGPDGPHLPACPVWLLVPQPCDCGADALDPPLRPETLAELLDQLHTTPVPLDDEAAS